YTTLFRSRQAILLGLGDEGHGACRPRRSQAGVSKPHEVEAAQRSAPREALGQAQEGGNTAGVVVRTARQGGGIESCPDHHVVIATPQPRVTDDEVLDRKSTRLNSSHVKNS